jgi:hypothetical protein
MKKLDSKGLFDIFSQGDEAIYQEHGIPEALDNNFVLFGTVVRGVENYFIIDKIYSYKFGEEYDSVSDSIKMKYFNGLINYLERIDVSQSDTLKDLLDEFEPQVVKSVLQELLDFYEEKEVYEKCAIIFKFFDILFAK